MAHCLWLKNAHNAIQGRERTERPVEPDTRADGDTLSEWQGKALLRESRAVPVPPGWLLQAQDACPEDLEFPAVAKLQSSQLLHKSDVGGVILNIAGHDDLRETLQQLQALGEKLALPVEGVLVEPMLPFDHELLIGLRRDPRFGPVLTIARGGVEAELDPDVVSLLLPASAQDIEAALNTLRCAKLLKGYRNKPGADVPSIAAQLATLCTWFENESLREVEINPLAISGRHIWALDALITPLN